MTEVLRIYGTVDGHQAIFERSYTGAEGDTLEDGMIAGCVAWLHTQGFVVPAPQAAAAPQAAGNTGFTGWHCPHHPNGKTRASDRGGFQCGEFDSTQQVYSQQKPWVSKTNEIRWYCSGKSA